MHYYITVKLNKKYNVTHTHTYCIYILYTIFFVSIKYEKEDK